ncbi:polysialyltransferase family glycosyltransferase [Anaerosacchariphilus polymeriproducens]|uniref:Uncharacterized protein n=1 Tax=Anaerosacchariphilus polymeriproducens TaxID=1812858 RepID=A0A371ATA5_9FIRM|nr:polysialyltransferase family glycosyltransferase [Anaerosacchariphilus polymeriproducens]RDU22805.1 hypothetical protein DWV06_12725 [Anaerosacchariphilus polymeriproducens]
MEKSKNIYEISYRIKQDKKLNFISFAITPWHALGVMGALEVLKKKGCHLEGMICICPHTTGGVLLDKSFFSSVESDKVEIFTFRGSENVSNKKMKQYLKTIPLRDGEDFFVISPLKPQYEIIEKISLVRKNDRITAVVIDEGLATYMRDTKSWLQSQKREEKKDIISLDEILNKLLLEKYYLKYLNKYKLCMNQNIFIKNHKQELVMNRRAIYGYRSILKKMKSENQITNANDYANAVVINTQPYFEEGRFKSEIDLKVIENACDFFQNQNLSVILKVHPREDLLERYQNLPCKIDTSGGVPMELLLASLKVKPKYLVGFTTTTLVTAKLFFGIEGISLINLVDSNEMEMELKKEFHRFAHYFKEYIKIPNYLQELEQK